MCSSDLRRPAYDAGVSHPATDPDALIERIRSSVIGDDEAVVGPFGLRRVTYADYTASARALTFVEDWIREAVLPLYANTHTESSGTGLQTTRFREDARAIIRDAVGGSADLHAVIFTGAGMTGATNLLVGVLELRIPAGLDDRFGLSRSIPRDQRPVVFIGPYEHHSNELPWRESIADVVTIGEDQDGRIDLARLEAALIEHADRPLKIGSFSAASNVTGILSDTRAISVLLHEHGALSFWDFAAAGPYVEIEMEPHRDSSRTGPHGGVPDGKAGLDYKDAVVVSPHKFIGGPGTPGVLVARRELFRNRVPVSPGGGTVAYVNPLEHVYLDDPEHREEGGTPAIIESIRAGLVFGLKEAVGVDAIRGREEDFIERAIATWLDTDPRATGSRIADDAVPTNAVRTPPITPTPTAPPIVRLKSTRPVATARRRHSTAPWITTSNVVDTRPMPTPVIAQATVTKASESMAAIWVTSNEPRTSMPLPARTIGRAPIRMRRRPAITDATGHPIDIAATAAPASSGVPPWTPWTIGGT